MKLLNLFLVLTIMSIFAVSCAPAGIKFTSGKEINAKIATTPAEMEGLSKAEMRVANATLTRSVATMIDSATKNPNGYKDWKKVIVALTELTKNPDEKITTINNNNNKSSIAGELSRSNSFSNFNNRSSRISQIPGFTSKNGIDYFWDEFDPLHKKSLPKGVAETINEDGINCKTARIVLAAINKIYNL